MFKYFVTDVLFSTNVDHNVEVMTHWYKFYSCQQQLGIYSV